MGQNRQYERDLTKYDKECLKYQYSLLLKSKGFLSTSQKKTLFKFKREPHIDESDCWYKIRRRVRNSLLELQFIAEIMDDNQLKDIFESLTNEDHKYHDQTKGQLRRTDLSVLLSRILYSNQQKSGEYDFRYQIARDVVIQGLQYLGQRKEFRRNLYNRLFQDVQDALNPYY